MDFLTLSVGLKLSLSFLKTHFCLCICHLCVTCVLITEAALLCDIFGLWLNMLAQPPQI